MKPLLLPLLALPLMTPVAGSPSETWERINHWSIGDAIFPSLHLHSVGGVSSTDAEDLASGAHDPQREAFSAQAIEPGLSLQTKYIEGFANYLWHQEAEGDWDGEWEEAFGKITNIPGGFEFKGGQYLSRFGALNDKHVHSWDFVDSEMVLSRFLGDDGLLLQGGEIAWTLPLGMQPTLVSIASLGYGNARSHDHAHSHGEGEDFAHEGEEAALSDDIWTARLMARYRFDDFHSLTAGMSWTAGTNGFERDTEVFGIDAEYQWRENGLESGGRAFRWRNELLWRDVDAYSEHDEDDDGIIDEIYLGSYQEWGVYTHAIYSWNERIDTGLRLGWVEGVADFGQDERFRVSPAVTWWFDDSKHIGIRAQYNYDSIASQGDEHSLWLQLSIALGSHQEVR